MTKASVITMSGLAAAALAISTSAMARPGGGMGGGMGIRNDMNVGRGADLPNRADSQASIRSSTDISSRPTVSTHTPTTLLERNAHLDAALSRSLTRRGIALPTGGLKSACAGYNTLGNCVAALHVAHNLGLPGGFTALKGLTAGSNAVSLGAAVKQLRPSADAKAAVRMAKHQASSDIEAIGG